MKENGETTFDVNLSTVSQSSSFSFYLTSDETLTVTFRMSDLTGIQQKQFIWDCLKNIDFSTAPQKMVLRVDNKNAEKPYNNLFNNGIEAWIKENIKLIVLYDTEKVHVQGKNEILDFVILDGNGNRFLIEGASNVDFFGEKAATVQKHFLKFAPFVSFLDFTK